MAKGDPHERQKGAGHEREVVDYTFRVTIDVHGPPDADARLIKLIDAEFERLYAAIKQKKQQ